MTTREFHTQSADESIAAGHELSRILRSGDIIVLRGELGAGKTTLVKGIAEGFKAARQEDVTSPTFTLIHEYRGPEVTLFHLDLYRIETERELLTLAFDDLRSEPASILLVEWGEKFGSIVAERNAEIAITRTGENSREIVYRQFTSS
jgi:tRNA threonylcarbamoyladenosine biosynthesis protein TsaE